MINWLWPLTTANGSYDIESGWQLDARNWAVITAAENRVETAAQMSGGVNIAQVQNPTAQATESEIAWHFFQPSMNSGYMYYGAVQDMPVKQTIACNPATDHADAIINKSSVADLTAPSIFAPQRLPYNPGGMGAGSLWNYQYIPMPSDFYVWTFVYDVSGVASVTLYLRVDDDGENPLHDNANEVFSPEKHNLTGVGPWQTFPMVYRKFPAPNVYNWSGIDFFVMPNYIADEYYYYVTGFKNILLDYYLSAVDTKGNVKNSDIYHVWVGNNTGKLP